jgi:uncharacterized damage-inducible protein DinB
MIGRPEPNEAAPYYLTYIDRIQSDRILSVLESQLTETTPLLEAISEEQSRYRYEPGKWSIREALNHISDCERTFLLRALWFARSLEGPMPSFDQNIAATTARADEFSWSSHLDEFRQVRMATIAFFRNLPEEGWKRTGIASGNSVSVRALAYIIAGHLSHHVAVLKDKYLDASSSSVNH